MGISVAHPQSGSSCTVSWLNWKLFANAGHFSGNILLFNVSELGNIQNKTCTHEAVIIWLITWFKNVIFVPFQNVKFASAKMLLM